MRKVCGSPSRGTRWTIESPTVSSLQALWSVVAFQRVRRSSEATPGGGAAVGAATRSGRTYPAEVAGGGVSETSVAGWQALPQRQASALTRTGVRRSMRATLVGKGSVAGLLLCTALLSGSHALAQPSTGAGPVASPPSVVPTAPSDLEAAPAQAGAGDPQPGAMRVPPPQRTSYLLPAATAAALVGTSWRAVDSMVSPHRIVFGTTTMSSVSHAGEATVAWVDLSGVHPACLGFPRCVLEVSPTGAATPVFLAGSVDTLYVIDCVRWSEVGDGGQMPTERQIGESSGVQLIWQSGDVMCLHMGRPMYQIETP